VAELLRLAEDKGLPMRAWIPFADAGSENRPALSAIIEKLRLGISRSGVRWAAYKATQEARERRLFPFVRIPSRPAATPDEGQHIAHVKTLHGTVLKYQDPFTPAVKAGEWGTDHDPD
jgi:hypothetical protein